jgi:hypothetical protein
VPLIYYVTEKEMGILSRSLRRGDVETTKENIE